MSELADLLEIAEYFDPPRLVRERPARAPRTGRFRHPESGDVLHLAADDSIRKHVAIITIKFAGSSDAPPTLDAVRTSFATTVEYFEAVSYGATYVTGEVYGPVTVVRGTGCANWDWHRQARAFIDESLFTNVMVIGPRSSDCTFAGIAYVGGKYSYLNGTAGWSTMAHELGHNFGLHHAKLQRADGTVSEYGDTFDRMGSGLVQFSTAFRHRLGILDEADVRDITTTSTVVVSAAEVEEGTPKLLRIARPNGTFLTVETRRAVGEYAPASTALVVKGVLIREINGNRSTLFDTHPDSTSSVDAALAAGESWTDPLSGVRLEVKAVADLFSTVKVTVPGTPDEVDPMLVFIANGEGWVDGLIAATGAAATNGRVLLTRATTLPAETANALLALKPTEIVIVGGTGVVSADVEARLQTFAPTSRVGGANRYETAAKVATR